ncbi:MAG: tetratricopeptide repeat protein, partial [Algoriella sp.]
QKALKSYHIAIKEDPQLDKAWAKAASLYDKLGNFEEAEYYINRAIDLDDKNVEYYSSATYYYLKQLKFEEAIKNLAIIVEMKPLVFNSWYAYSETLIAIGEYEQAIPIIIAALRNFNRAELFYQLSNVYYLTDQNKLGDEAFTNALLLNKSLKESMLDNYPILQEKITQLNLK